MVVIAPPAMAEDQSIQMAHSAIDIPLNLDAALRTAFRNRPELKQATVRINKARAGIDEAKGRFLPSVDLAVKLKRNHIYDEFTGIDVEAEFQGHLIPVSITPVSPDYTSTASLDMTWNLYSGGENDALLDAARTHYQIERTKAKLVRQDIFVEVLKAYFEVVKKELDFGQSETVLQVAQQRSRIAQKRLDDGEIAEIDWQQEQVQLREAEFSSAQARRAFNASVRDYLTALGFGVSQLSVDDLRSLHLSGSEDLGVVKTLIKHHLGALKSQLDIRSSDLQLAREFKRQVIAEYQPKVDLFFSFTGRGRSSPGDNSDVFSSFKRSDAVFGVSMQWNLFSGQQTTARDAQAVNDIEIATLALDEERRKQGVVRRQASAKVAEQRDRVMMEREKLELRDAKAKLSAQRLAMDLIPVLQHQEAVLDLKQSEVDTQKALIDLIIVTVDARLSP